jgi:GNAT superfamily N-acetyltransferase
VRTDDEAREWFASVVIPDRELWVVTHDDLPVALLVLDGGWIDQLYVDPKWTGQGLGSVLVGIAKERRPKYLDLWTFESNLGARRFYERHGFLAVGSTDGDNEEGAPDVHYRWTASD